MSGGNKPTQTDMYSILLKVAEDTAESKADIKHVKESVDKRERDHDALEKRVDTLEKGFAIHTQTEKTHLKDAGYAIAFFVGLASFFKEHIINIFK